MVAAAIATATLLSHKYLLHSGISLLLYCFNKLFLSFSLYSFNLDGSVFITLLECALTDFQRTIRIYGYLLKLFTSLEGVLTN